jgi:Holliday junction resolvasome RuvABC endonuclease subunit
MFQPVTSDVLGIDPSLNSLGYSYYSNCDELVTGTIVPKKLKGSERLNYHYKELGSLLAETPTRTVLALEGYSMGSAGRGNNNVFKMGELGGIIRLVAWQSGIDILLVPPKTLKLYIAGNGNADKDKVISAVREEYGIDFTGRDDEADAFALMQFGFSYLSRRKPRIEHKRRALLKGELIKGCPF